MNDWTTLSVASSPAPQKSVDQLRGQVQSLVQKPYLFFSKGLAGEVGLVCCSKSESRSC